LVSRLGREGATIMLNNNTSRVVTSKDALIHRLTLSVSSQETANEGVTSTVGVDDLGGVNKRNGNFTSLTSLRVGPDGGILASGEDDDTGTSGSLGELSGLHGDLLEVLGFVKLLHDGKGFSFIFVGEDDVDHGEDFVEGVSEELHDEGGGEVHGDLGSVTRGAFVASLQESGGVGEGEASKIDDGNVIEDFVQAGRLQVISVEGVGGTEVGEESAFLSDDADGAGTSGVA